MCMSVFSYPSSCSPLASVPPNYEDDGDYVYSTQESYSIVGEEQPIPRPPPPVKAKRQRGTVGDGEGGEDGRRERQRKRRKTEFTQATLVDPTQYNPFRNSPLSKAAASERAPSQDFLTPTRLPLFDFSKHTKRIPVRHLRAMDFTASRGKRRESAAQRVADQTFVLEHEDTDEESEAVIRSEEESLRLSEHHQEEDFGEVTELQTPKRQRKSQLNPDLIPAMTYQSEITFIHLVQTPLTLLCDSSSNWRQDSVSIPS
jgi:hypothetical protein